MYVLLVNCCLLFKLTEKLSPEREYTHTHFRPKHIYVKCLLEPSVLGQTCPDLSMIEKGEQQEAKASCAWEQLESKLLPTVVTTVYPIEQNSLLFTCGKLICGEDGEDPPPADCSCFPSPPW